MPSFVKHDVADIKLAGEGKLKIEWAGQQMPVLQLIKERFSREKPLKGITLGACLHVTSETANLMLALKAGGAKLALCASNPLSTQDSVAASLVKDFGIPTFAIKGEDNQTYYRHLQAVLGFKPNVTMDDGADLVTALQKLKIKYHLPAFATLKALQAGKSKIQIKNQKGESWEFLGSSEETTTGVIRLKAMEKDKALKVPVVAVNDSDT
ncbi:MAG: S-adenosyl-L-homocysteine hydrolase, partial [uncultured bacterium]